MLFERVLVAIDGSQHSQRAALVAARCCRDWGAKLTLLTVYRQPPGWEGEPSYSQDLEVAMDEARLILDAAKDAIAAEGGPNVDAEALGGQPVAAILDAASSDQYDLLVLGTRGLGRAMSAILGSISSQVAARSQIPVLIVRGGEDD